MATGEVTLTGTDVTTPTMDPITTTTNTGERQSMRRAKCVLCKGRIRSTIALKECCDVPMHATCLHNHRLLWRNGNWHRLFHRCPGCDSKCARFLKWPRSADEPMDTRARLMDQHMSGHRFEFLFGPCDRALTEHNSWFVVLLYDFTVGLYLFAIFKLILSHIYRTIFK